MTCLQCGTGLRYNSCYCRKCITEVHPEYIARIVPESLRQRTAACFFQDLWLFERPWSFDLADIPAAAQRSIHIWHGTGDKQVVDWSSESFQDARRITNGLHVHYASASIHS